MWPLVVEVISGQDISVGAPYFKIVFLPLIFPAVFLSGISINLKLESNKFRIFLW